MRSLIFNVFLFAGTFLTALIAWIVAKLGTRDQLFGVVHRWGRLMLWGVRTILGATVEVRGWQHVTPGQPQLIVSKHQSELDIVMLCALFPQFSAVAMQELEGYPFFGPILRSMGLVLVAVKQGRQGRTDQVIAGGHRVKAEGTTMMIYPEGELMKLGARERYRSGFGHLYETMGVEAVPVALSLGVIWPQRRWTKHPGTTGAIEFLEPIPPGMGREAFMAEAEERIEQATMRLIREHTSGARLAEAEDLFRRRANNSG